MEYYLFKNHRLARSNTPDITLDQYEWLVNGEWKEDDERWSRALNAAMINYGDYSIWDYDHLTPEIAEELIENGTIVLQGNIGYGAFYREPKTIHLSNWKKPSKTNLRITEKQKKIINLKVAPGTY